MSAVGSICGGLASRKAAAAETPHVLAPNGRGIASPKLKHVDIHSRRVDKDAREVRTKFSKTFSTWFFPVGGQALQVIEDWVAYLRGTLLWGKDDPLFLATLMRQSESGGFIAAGLRRKHWSSADPIRRIFSKVSAVSAHGSV